MKLIPSCKQFKKTSEYLKCKNSFLKQFSQESYFFQASLSQLCKHFLGTSFNFKIFKANFIQILEAYKIVFEDNECPMDEKEFYRYIAKEYLDLECAPKDKLFDLYQNVNEDLIEIDNTIALLIKKLEEIKKLQETNGFLDVEDRYQRNHIQYYIQKNKTAKDEIIDFLTFKIKNIAHNESKTKGILQNFNRLFGTNSYPYRLKTESFFPFSNTYDIDSFSDLDNKLLELSIPDHKKIQKDYKDGKYNDVLIQLKAYLEEMKLIENIKILAKKNHILNRRIKIFDRIFKHLKNRDFISVNNMLPLQIEGLFHDYCLLIGIQEKELNISSLNAKLDKLKDNDKSNDVLLNYEYFSFRFPIIRNKVAHGQYLDEDDEFQSIFLIFDLFSVCEMITNEKIVLNYLLSIIDTKKSNDYEKIFELIDHTDVEIPTFYRKQIKKMTTLKAIYRNKKFIDFIESKTFNHPKDLLDDLKKKVIKIKTKLIDQNDDKTKNKYQELLKKISALNLSRL